MGENRRRTYFLLSALCCKFLSQVQAIARDRIRLNLYFFRRVWGWWEGPGPLCTKLEAKMRGGATEQTREVHKLGLAQRILLGPELFWCWCSLIHRGGRPLNSEIAQIALRLCKCNYFPSNCLMFLTTLTHSCSSPPKSFEV